MNKVTSEPRSFVTGAVAAAWLIAVLCAGFPVVGRTAASQERTSAPEPSAAQIIAKNIDARGGLEAWRRVNTMVWLGHIASAHAAAPSMPFVMEQKRPNKTRFEIHVMNETTQRIFNGTQGWKVHPEHGDRPAVEAYSLQELRFAQSGPGIDGPLIDYASKGYSVALEGIDDIEGHKTYRLSLRLPTGETDRIWIDAKTFLEVRYDRPSDGSIGAARNVSVLYSDYRNYDGLQLPSVIETGVGSGTTPDKMMIERVALNPPLDDERFEQPGAPHRHRSTRPLGTPAPPVAQPLQVTK